MAENKELLSVKLDLVFKLIFGDQRNTDILSSFLKSVLDIPEEEYERITIVDPHVKADFPGDKYGILDVKIHTKSGQVIHTEIQITPIPEMDERTLYYQSKMVTEQIGSGQDYSQIKKVVSIIITDYALKQLSGSGRYHHQFRYRTDDGIELTDLAEINTLELSKLPDETDRTELWNWMRFMATKNEEELNMLATKSPELKKAVGVLKELSADERTRMIAEDREKARRDMASRLDGARREGREEGVENERKFVLELLAQGLSAEEIKQRLTSNER
jgi:predicted transposase/invertase (TIGR01784 family)